MTLDADEFIRRFLLHVLPDGFRRIRHFGFLANACRTTKLAQIRAAFEAPEPPSPGGAEQLPRALRAAHGSSDRPVPPVRRLHGRPWSFAAPPQAGLAPDAQMRQLMTAR